MKSFFQYVVILFVGALALMYTLSWFSGQPRLPYFTVLFADGLAALVVVAVFGAVGLIAGLFSD